jgi:hypothetical protein
MHSGIKEGREPASPQTFLVRFLFECRFEARLRLYEISFLPKVFTQLIPRRNMLGVELDHLAEAC